MWSLRVLLVLPWFVLACGDSTSEGDPSNVSDAGTQNDAGSVFDAGSSECIELSVYADGDGDGWGDQLMTQMACLAPGEALEGYARNPGDCRPNDRLAHPGAEGICGDYVDDDCDGNPSEPCPETQTAAVDIPDWDCTGTAPNNVYAYARFDDGGGYYRDGSCFVFFEGLPDEFYVKHDFTRVNQDVACDQVNGCVCPSLNGWPSYDRRIYAMTTDSDRTPCEELQLDDTRGGGQPVSNDCRKYLYQMHFYDIPYTYVAGSLENLEQRLSEYDTLEVSCLNDWPHANLPYQQLLTTPIVFNPGFVKK